MMKIGVLGINHKLADVGLREKVAEICNHYFSSNPKRAFALSPTPAFVLLSTCNRTEVYFSSTNLPETHTSIVQLLRQELEFEFDQRLYSFFGADCFLHLARVTAGLDSAIIGETEIQGQVKTAYESSRLNTPIPQDLHFLFQRSLRLGKKLRTEYPLHQSRILFEQTLYKTGVHFFDKHEIKNPRVLIVGASEINLKVVRYLQSKGISDITLCNRTNEKANAWAKEYNLQALDWNSWNWQQFDCVIAGTKSPTALITYTSQSFEKPVLLMDLGMPRNIDPALAKNSAVTLINLDQIHRIARQKEGKAVKMIYEIEKHARREIQKYLAIQKCKCTVLDCSKEQLSVII